MAARRSGAQNKRPQRKKTESAPRGEPPLSLERIVATAIELLDTGGTAGLTMRGLADRLGSGVMS
ncbi:hypothetical protein Q6316_28895, partial [Klebsiella pneumoniae]|uniref:hypothetical protein n=1 Tax=Klebsiella pneumoniae TaxID=573 RepID=UPI0027310AE8